MNDKLETTPLVDRERLPYIDPTQHPPRLCLSVRTFTRTDVKLTHIADALGLTFWGEVVGLIFDYFAHYPNSANLEHLDQVPKWLTRKGRDMRPDGGPSSKIIQVPLTIAALHWLRCVARNQGMKIEKAATAILHKNLDADMSLVLMRRGVSL